MTGSTLLFVVKNVMFGCCKLVSWAPVGVRLCTLTRVLPYCRHGIEVGCEYAKVADVLHSKASTDEAAVAP